MILSFILRKYKVDKDVSITFSDYFGQFKDPSIDRKKLYPLIEILFVVLAGSICEAESWRDFVFFGEAKIDFLKKYYPFNNEIPCKDTFARLFQQFPVTFEQRPNHRKLSR